MQAFLMILFGLSAIGTGKLFGALAGGAFDASDKALMVAALTYAAAVLRGGDVTALLPLSPDPALAARYAMAAEGLEEVGRKFSSNPARVADMFDGMALALNV